MSEGLPSKPPASGAPRSRLEKRVLAVFLALLLGLAFSELVLRLVGNGPIPIDRPSLLVYFWVRDAKLGFRNRADGDFHDVRTGSHVHTGRFGERLGVHWDGETTRPTVLFVGDSTTFCGEVEDDETYPSEVAKLLPDHVPCVNLGVAGYNTVQSLRMTEEWLDRVPAKLVVYMYCDNDYIENVLAGDLEIQKPSHPPHAEVGPAGLHLIDVPADAGPWGAPVGVDGPLKFLDRIADVSAIGGVAKRLANRQDPTPWLNSFEIVEKRLHATEVLDGLLILLRDLCARRGVPLLVTRFTTGRSSLVEGVRFKNTNDKIEAACRKANVHFVDIQDAFTLPPNDYRAHLRGGMIDAHHNHLGTRTMGEALAPHIRTALEGH